ncbi:MAG: hypothetical protein KatS3mg103_0106 [Phycisphaerales bacterium]|nr:MAG: hypothetical protein KatS3mg103_0106 [Phycisphaerales bacterium]
MILIVKDAGFAQSVVQRQRITHAQVSNLFWINIAASLLAAAACAAMAPVMVQLFGRPELLNITLAMAVAAFIGSFGGIHRAMMQRQMRLGSLSASQIASQVGSIVIAVGMASSGYGYWALVGLQVARVTIDTAWVLAACRWVPGLPRRGAGAGGMARFGAYMIGHSLIAYGGRNLDNLLVGGWLGTAVLGQYTRAYGLLLMPIQQITSPIGRVAIPTLSRLAHAQPERYTRTYTRVLTLMAMVTMPGVATLMASADPLVLLLLGDGWDLVPDTFRWLGLAAIAQPLTGTLSWLMIAEGRAKEQFWYSVVYFVLLLACFLLATPFGIVTLAIAYGLSGILIRSPLAIFLVLRRSPVGIATFYRAVLPGTVAATLAFGAGTLAILATSGSAAPIALGAGVSASGLATCGCYLLVPAWRHRLLATGGWIRDLKPAKN